MRVNGKIVKLKEKVNTLIAMEQLMKVIGLKTFKKDMVKRPGLMGPLIKVNIVKVKKMAKGSSIGMMVHILKARFLKTI